MGIATCGEICKINNHMKANIKNVHEIKIKKGSKIYELLKKEKIITNSRHNFSVKNTILNVSGYTQD